MHTVALDVRDLQATARLPQELPAEFRVRGRGGGGSRRRLSGLKRPLLQLTVSASAD